MTEARIGRLVAACLHQAIADELSQRLEFYEHWLKSEHLAERPIGQAPLAAVLGFLRTEGDAYHRVMSRAGTLAAEWTLASMSPGRRVAMGWLPRGLKTRAALRLFRELVRSASSASRASTRVARGAVRLEIRRSLFCAAREQPRGPLCAFYLAAAVEILRAFDLPANGRLVECQAMTGTACVMTLALEGTVAASDPAMAA